MENSVIDLIIRLKNAYLAKKDEMVMPFSHFREAVLKKLVVLGFIKKYHVEGEKIKRIIVELIYKDGVPALTDVTIFSKPGRRYYISSKEIKPVLGGLGFSILSTSSGIKTDKEARQKRIGGELLFYIW